MFSFTSLNSAFPQLEKDLYIARRSNNSQGAMAAETALSVARLQKGDSMLALTHAQEAVKIAITLNNPGNNNSLYFDAYQALMNASAKLNHQEKLKETAELILNATDALEIHKDQARKVLKSNNKLGNQ